MNHSPMRSAGSARFSFRLLSSSGLRRLVAALLLSFALPQAMADGAVPHYRFGVVPQFEARKLFSIWQPLLRELSQRTGLQFDLVGQPAIPAFEKSFLAGEFDFAYMNPFHAVMAAETQGYEMLVRDGRRTLTGILVVRKDAPFKTVAELEGQTIAYPSPNALGASLLMRADLERLHGVRASPIYVQTHTSVYLNVVAGVAAAGGGVQRTLNEQPDSIKNQLRVLYRTREVKPHPIVAHPRVPAAHRKLVRDALLAMAQNEQGRLLLKHVPMGSTVPATLDDYRPLKDWGLTNFYMRP